MQSHRMCGYRAKHDRFPHTIYKHVISTEGGDYPRWSRDGRELFYRSGNKMIVVSVQTSPSFHPGTPKVLFEGNGYISSFDVSPDGKRILMVKRPATPVKGPVNQVTVVLNWFEELRRRAPPGR